MQKQLPPTETEKALLAILVAPIPSPRPGDLRHDQAARTKAIRGLIRDLKLAHISVIKATGSMCSWTNVDFPIADWPESEYQRIRELRYEASLRMTRIILAAFPDFDDRSDTTTDHFDSVFTIHS